MGLQSCMAEHLYEKKVNGFFESIVKCVFSFPRQSRHYRRLSFTELS